MFRKLIDDYRSQQRSRCRTPRIGNWPVAIGTATRDLSKSTASSKAKSSSNASLGLSNAYEDLDGRVNPAELSSATTRPNGPSCSFNGVRTLLAGREQGRR